MILGMVMMFLLFIGLALIFGANFIHKEKQRALLLVIGMVMALIPLGFVLVGLFYPVWE